MWSRDGRTRVFRPKVPTAVDGDYEGHGHAFAGTAGNFAPSTDALDPLLDVPQAISGRDPLCRRGGRLGAIEAPSIVTNRQRELVGSHVERNADLRRRGVFDRVVERLFESEKEVVANLGRQRPGWDLEGDIETATDARST